jgi:hypothetical protein
VPGLDLLARAREGGPCGLDRERKRLPGKPLVPCELVDRREIAQLHSHEV